MLVKQNANEKGAYNLGHDAGKEKAKDEYATELLSYREWLCNRILDVEDIGASENADTFLRGLNPWEAYKAGLEDMLKVLAEKLSLLEL